MYRPKYFVQIFKDPAPQCEGDSAAEPKVVHADAPWNIDTCNKSVFVETQPLNETWMFR